MVLLFQRKTDGGLPLKPYFCGAFQCFSRKRGLRMSRKQKTTMKKERTLSEAYLHKKPENWNCAQSLLKGFQKECSITDSEIEQFRAWGGGRAEGGVCGAMHAASHLLGEDSRKDLEESFVQEFGTFQCRELKRNKIACVDCVRLADKLVEQEMNRRQDKKQTDADQ